MASIVQFVKVKLLKTALYCLLTILVLIFIVLGVYLWTDTLYDLILAEIKIRVTYSFWSSEFTLYYLHYFMDFLCTWVNSLG